MAVGIPRGEGSRAAGEESASSDRRREIAALAAELFLAEGYAATSMARVARAARIRKPSLYHHFASKEALFVAAMTLDLADGAVRLAALRGSDLCHDERLRAALRIVYESIVVAPAGRMVPVLAETASRFPAIAASFHDGFAAPMDAGFEAVVADGVAARAFRPIDPVTLHHLVFGPPVSLAISQAMFAGIAAARDHLDPEAARSGQEEALLRVLHP